MYGGGGTDVGGSSWKAPEDPAVVVGGTKENDDVCMKNIWHGVSFIYAGCVRISLSQYRVL